MVDNLWGELYGTSDCDISFLFCDQGRNKRSNPRLETTNLKTNKTRKLTDIFALFYLFQLVLFYHRGKHFRLEMIRACCLAKLRNLADVFDYDHRFVENYSKISRKIDRTCCFDSCELRKTFWHYWVFWVENAACVWKFSRSVKIDVWIFLVLCFFSFLFWSFKISECGHIQNIFSYDTFLTSHFYCSYFSSFTTNSVVHKWWIFRKLFKDSNFLQNILFFSLLFS